MKINTPEDLTKIKTDATALLSPDTPRITIGSATCGKSKGADKIAEALKYEIKKQKLDADIVPVGCNGMCFAEPVVEVICPGKPRITYGNVGVDHVAEIVAAAASGKVVETLAMLRRDEEQQAVCAAPVKYSKGKLTKAFEKIEEYRKSAFFAQQTKLVSRNAGTISPESIEEYIALGGYQALVKALSSMTPEKVLQEVTVSKLRGRGGAGFPASMKWEACRDAPGEKKYVVCNGSEGDPEIGMHRSFLESDPHSLIEGMILAGFAIGAQEGYIYLNDRYLLALQRVTEAVKQAEKLGLLGKDIMGSGFSFNIKIKRGGGAYVCGEETALLNSLEGSFGEPRPRPPYPAQQGLFGMPTVVNNLETLSNIPLIVIHGGKWFAGIGTPKSTGTKIVALSGSVDRGCWVEVPMGTPVEEIIKTFGNGAANGKTIKAFQTGGPSGGILPAKSIKTKLDYESLAKAGTMLGSGGLLVMDEDVDVIDMTKFFTDFFADETCGKCTSCREGIKRLQEIVDSFVQGRGTTQHLDIVKRMASGMNDTCACALGKTAAVPFISAINHFPQEVEKRMLKKIG